MSRRAVYGFLIVSVVIALAAYRLTADRDPAVTLTDPKQPAVSADGLRCGPNDASELRSGSHGDFAAGHVGRFDEPRAAIASYLNAHFSGVTETQFVEVPPVAAASRKFVLRVGGDTRMSIDILRLGGGWEVSGHYGCASFIGPFLRQSS